MWTTEKHSNTGSFPSFKRLGIGRGRGLFPPVSHSESSELCLPPLLHPLETAGAVYSWRMQTSLSPGCVPCTPWSRCRGWAGAQRSGRSAAASGWEGTSHNRSACPCPCHSDTLPQQGTNSTNRDISSGVFAHSGAISLTRWGVGTSVEGQDGTGHTV